MLTVGRVGTDVTGVTLVLGDGTSVQATVTNGWYAAWWPGNGAPDSRDHDDQWHHNTIADNRRHGRHRRDGDQLRTIDGGGVDARVAAWQSYAARPSSRLNSGSQPFQASIISSRVIGASASYRSMPLTADPRRSTQERGTSTSSSRG